MFSGFLHYLLIISLEMSDEPKKMYFLENIKSFHSAKLRFTFTHVYTCISKPKMLNSIIMVRVYFTLLYIRKSKLKPKLTPPEFVCFSFDRNKIMAR